jgi:hypothetical protein
MGSWRSVAWCIGPVRTSSESEGAETLSMSVREFMPPARAAAPILSKAHSSRRSAGEAGPMKE